MKNKVILKSIFMVLVLSALLAAGCQKEAGSSSATSPDTFASTFRFTDEERSISISGDSDVMPGGRSEYALKIQNDGDRWQSEYYILLLDSDSVVKEVSHEIFDIPKGGGIQKPVFVDFPEGFEGALGLCVLVPERATFVSTLSVGVKDAVSTGWPDISDYPLDKAVN